MKAIIDVGGTYTRIAVSNDGQQLNFQDKFPTPQALIEAVEKISSVLREKAVSSLVMGVPGVVDKKSGALIKAPHLPDWNNQKPAALIAKKLGMSGVAHLINDTALAALGEATAGAGKGFLVIGYLSIGTGIGGARVVQGRVDVASQGFEPGHQIIVPNGKEWPYCGQRGCLEAYISGTTWTSQGLTNDYYQYLGQGLVNIIVLWSPDIIVLGGGLIKLIDIEQVQMATEKLLSIVKAPPIVKGALGDEAALYGGLVYVL